MMQLSGTILVADDEPMIRRILEAFFQKRGLKVLTAASGEEVLQRLTEKPIAVLLDINMPGLSGVETLKRVHALQPQLPVIMVTANEDEETIREALEAGAYDYVVKPFSLEYLETVLLTKILLGLES
jgi:DNA-binding response OmpR family regulator